MSAVADLTTCKSDVISLLQASRTPYASTVDGSNAQYNSNTEIANAILYADAEICNVIINTPGHPFQYAFVTNASGLTNSSTLPQMTGMILKVQGLNGEVSKTIASMSASTDLLTVTAHGFTTGQLIQITTDGIIGGGLSVLTNYYVIYVSVDTLRLAVSPYAASINSYINISAIEPVGTSLMVLQYVDAIQAKTADEVKMIVAQGGVYSNDISTNNSLFAMFFIEGKILYITTVWGKIYYTDFTLTAACQSPQAYLNTIVCGALKHLYKDGGDLELSQYYGGMFDQGIQMIAAGSKIVPDITAYKLAA